MLIYNEWWFEYEIFEYSEYNCWVSKHNEQFDSKSTTFMFSLQVLLQWRSLGVQPLILFLVEGYVIVAFLGDIGDYEFITLLTICLIS